MFANTVRVKEIQLKEISSKEIRLLAEKKAGEIFQKILWDHPVSGKMSQDLAIRVNEEIF